MGDVIRTEDGIHLLQRIYGLKVQKMWNFGLRYHSHQTNA
jgi:hypothetical protein